MHSFIVQGPGGPANDMETEMEAKEGAPPPPTPHTIQIPEAGESPFMNLLNEFAGDEPAGYVQFIKPKYDPFKSGCGAFNALKRVTEAVAHAIASKGTADPRELYDINQIGGKGSQVKPGGLDTIQFTANSFYRANASLIDNGAIKMPNNPFANWAGGQREPATETNGIRLLQLGGSEWNDDNYKWWLHAGLKYWKNELVRQAVLVNLKHTPVTEKNKALQRAKRLKFVKSDCVEYVRIHSDRVRKGKERPFDVIIINVSFNRKVVEGTVTQAFLEQAHDLLKPGGVLCWKVHIWARDAPTWHYNPIWRFAVQAGFQWACIDPNTYIEEPVPSSDPPPEHVEEDPKKGELIERSFMVAWKGIGKESMELDAKVFPDDPPQFVVPEKTPTPSPEPDTPWIPVDAVTLKECQERDECKTC